MRRQPGLVLVVVVITLAIVCLMLYQLSTLAFARVRSVVELERTMRQHWSIVSCRKTMLQNATDFFAVAEGQVNLPDLETGQASDATYLIRLEDSLQLNGMEVQFELCRESAKLNIPRLMQARPENDVQRTVERLVGGRGQRLAPGIFQRRKSVNGWDWRSMFDLGDQAWHDAHEVGQRLTLWGSGRIDVYRADVETLEETWRVMFGHFPPSEIIAIRDSYPPVDWSQLRSAIGLRDEQAELADRWFQTTSDCYSLWLEVGTGNFAEEWLFVADRNSENYGFKL